MIAFELVLVRSSYYRKNIYHRMSMCYQTVLKFQILLRKTFYNWNFPRVINKVDKTTGAQITAVIGSL